VAHERHRVEGNPGGDEDRLPNYVLRRAEEASRTFGAAAKSVRSKGAVMLAGHTSSVQIGADISVQESFTSERGPTLSR
jgi:hypothetical protein